MDIIDFKNKNGKKNVTMTKEEVLDKLKRENITDKVRLPYKKEMLSRYKSGEIQANNMYWVYDSTSPVFFDDSGEMKTFRKMKSSSPSKAFHILVEKKPRFGKKRTKAKSKPKAKSEKITNLDSLSKNLEFLSKKLDLVLEAMEMNSISYKSNNITITKGNVKIEL